jgi:hypothetical protein
MPKQAGAAAESFALVTERYTYPALGLENILGVFGILLGPCIIGGGIYTLERGGWFLIPMGMFWTWFMGAAQKLSFEKYRPLEIDETGVKAMAFKRVWKFIPWSEVKQIERVRTTIFTQLGWRYGYELTIIGEHDRIRLNDRILKLPRYEKYPALVESLNGYIQRYAIPLAAFDRGDDTLAQVKVTMMDREGRKKLLKEGVPSEITML